MPRVAVGRCPFCDGRCLVNDVRHEPGATWRRKECTSCARRFNTAEIVIPDRAAQAPKDTRTVQERRAARRGYYVPPDKERDFRLLRKNRVPIDQAAAIVGAAPYMPSCAAKSDGA